MSENYYERFRSILIMNLMQTIDPSTINDVMMAVDVSMSDFEITRKQTDIIPYTGNLEVVKVYIASKAVANLSMGTLKQYRYKLENFFNTVKKSFENIRAEDIRMYLFKYKTEHNASNCYMDNIRITLNSFFQWLTDNGYLDHNPCKNVEQIHYQKNERKPLSAYELEEIRWDCEDVREKALIDFLFSTGCRVSECAALNENDIDWNMRSVMIRHGKGDKARVVFFNAESELSLKKYIMSRQSDDGSLFPRSRLPYTRMTSHSIEEIIKKVSLRTGINVFPHKLRHTFATHGLNSGVPIDQLQKLMGHSSPKTTLIYAKQDNTKLRVEHQKAFC